MSLNKLAQMAAENQVDADTARNRQYSDQQLNQAANRSPSVATVTENQTSSTINKAADALIKYIPTEIITLYVAATSAGPGLKVLFGGHGNRQILYWGFVCLTPIALLLLYWGSLQAERKPFPSISNLPWWKLIASTIAFGVWGLSVPRNPFVSEPIAGVAAGFLAGFVSVFLNILAPIFERQPDQEEK